MCVCRLASGPQEGARLFGGEADHSINVAAKVCPGAIRVWPWQMAAGRR